MTNLRIGFLGLGTMGEPMATRLLAAGSDLTVWNRSAPARDRLVALGAQAVATPADVFVVTEVVILMLANGDAIDGTLGRRGARFGVEVGGRVVVNMGTVAPSYSLALGEDLEAAGATFVEAPVSGSKGPALAGELVGMMAGEQRALDLVEGLLAPITSAVFRCGAVPRALETKLAVNTYLITMVVGLTEAFAFAERRGVDPAVLCRVLDAGPMASTVSRGKLAKLVEGDRSAQAAVGDVLYNSRLILDAAGQASALVPLTTACATLLAETESRGHGTKDVVAVVDALRSSTR